MSSLSFEEMGVSEGDNGLLTGKPRRCSLITSLLLKGLVFGVRNCYFIISAYLTVVGGGPTVSNELIASFFSRFSFPNKLSASCYAAGVRICITNVACWWFSMLPVRLISSSCGETGEEG